MRFFLLFLLLTACGHETKVDPALQGYVDLYLSRAPNMGKFEEITEIKLADDVSSDEDGHCTDRSQRIAKKAIRHERRVLIRNGLMPNYEKAVTMHELAHCVHDIDHVDDDYDIMGANFITDDAYWADHFDEEFDKLMVRIGN